MNIKLFGTSVRFHDVKKAKHYAKPDRSAWYYLSKKVSITVSVDDVVERTFNNSFDAALFYSCNYFVIHKIIRDELDLYGKFKLHYNI